MDNQNIVDKNLKLTEEKSNKEQENQDLMKKALDMRENGEIKIGNSCLGEIRSIVECPYRETNCEDKICPKFMAYLDVNDKNTVKQELNEMGFDIDNMETFELLMSMQKLFATKFHKVTNLSKTEKDYWINSYLVCIEDEVREVREHLNIYPDGKCLTNKMEMKKEIIDILHFMMDEFICGGATFEDIKKYYLKEFSPMVKDVSDLFAYACETQKNNVKSLYEKNTYDTTCLLLVNKLLDCSAKVRQCISWKHWKKPTDTIDQDKLFTAFAQTFKIFVDLCVYNNMFEKEIKNIYISKNLENRFRQKWGY